MARVIGMMKEADAVEMVYGHAYRWLTDHGYPNPTLIDCSIRMSEYRHDRQNTILKAVAEWESAEEFDSPEGARRIRVSERAFKAARKLYGESARSAYSRR